MKPRAASYPRRQIPNPAASFCEKSGGTYETRTNADGSQHGVCIIDGKEYDAWDFFRKHHRSKRTLSCAERHPEDATR